MLCYTNGDVSEYTEVPKDCEDDNVIPYISSISPWIRSMRHPRKSRSVTLGPQSQADIYETLAYREKRRRESNSESVVASPRVLGAAKGNGSPSNGLPTSAHPDVDYYEKMMGGEVAVYSPLPPNLQPDTIGSLSRSLSQDRRQYEKEEREMLSTLKKPRVRYDVEVVTKLIVYMGKSHSDTWRLIKRS